MSNHSLTPMTSRVAYVPILILLLLAVPVTVAQTATPASETDLSEGATVGMQGGRFGVGLASSWPSYGISGTMQINEMLTGEVILGFLGAISNIGGRVWYRFKRDPSYDLYGYGSVGLLRYDYVVNTESVLGLGAGAGVEVGVGQLLDEEDFPPIFVNAEIGLAYANFDFYNFSSFTFGSGIHYRLGGN